MGWLHEPRTARGHMLVNALRNQHCEAVPAHDGPGAAPGHKKRITEAEAAPTLLQGNENPPGALKAQHLGLCQNLRARAGNSLFWCGKANRFVY